MIWDLPLRIFHWSLVVCVIGAFVSINAGQIELHEKFGLGVMGLIVFRIIWGFWGYPASRFKNFIPTPKAIFTYLRTHKNPHEGHNPLGALSVMAFIILLLTQTVTGSFSSDDILFDGPLLHLAPAFSNTAFTIHNFVRVLIFGLILLHWMALIVHRFAFKEKLVHRMITGGQGSNTPNPKRTLIGIILLVVCVVAAQSLVFLKP